MGSDTGYVFGTNRTRTICEVLRDINDQFQSDSEKHRTARDLIINAMLLTKKMVGILSHFRRGTALGTISDWLFDDNSAEHIKKAHAIRNRADYKVGGKFN